MLHISPNRIGLIGDTHGEVEVAMDALRTLLLKGVTEIHFIGDFGFVWSGSEDEADVLSCLEAILKKAGVIAYVTGGNHENYDVLHQFEPDCDGLRWLTGNIALLPRGWRAITQSGTTLASLGGANSVDRDIRREGVSWWSAEQITERDLAALGTEHVDVLLGHDCAMTHSLSNPLHEGNSELAEAGVDYANEGQAMFQRGFLAVTPKLAIGAHYGLFNDATEYFEGGPPSASLRFESRCVVLNDGRHHSIAELNLTTLSLVKINGTLTLSCWL